MQAYLFKNLGTSSLRGYSLDESGLMLPGGPQDWQFDKVVEVDEREQRAMVEGLTTHGYYLSRITVTRVAN